LKDLCADTILDAVIDPSYFLKSEWGGCNEVHLLNNGLLGVMGHMAFRTDEGLHYNAMTFVMDPSTGEHTAPRIIAARSDMTTEAFGKRPLAVRRGGSIPIISDFERVLGIKTVLMGFGLESNAIHSPNENFPLDMFRRGIEAVVGFHLHYDEMVK
jgi:acetylornithine deacetylase/succinyl-diaminopimelate desuccinylase-like protein